MSHICLITDSYPPEVRSSSLAMSEIAEELAALGHSVTVITTEPKYNLASSSEIGSIHAEDPQTKGVAVVRVRSKFLHNRGPVLKGLGQALLMFSAFRVGLRLRRVDAAIVYSPPLPLALVAIGIARVQRATCIVNVQDFFPQNAIDLGILKSPLLIRILRYLEKLVFRYADHITVPSEANLVWLTSMGYKHGSVVANWFDFTPLSRDPNRTVLREFFLRPEFTVLFGGVMGYAQDMDVILEAAKLLRQHGDIQFLLVGDGVQYAGVERAVAKEELSSVHLRKFVDAKTYRKLLSAVDVGLVTLKSAMKTPAVPSKTLGYFTAALPIVTAVNVESDLRRIIQEADAGFSVAAGDGAALANAIETLWIDAGLARRKGENGRKYGLQHFGVRKAALHYLSLIDSKSPHQ